VHLHVTVFDHAIAKAELSVRPSVRLSFSQHGHVPMFCLDEWRYNRAVFSVKKDNHSSFWRGEVYPYICRGSPPV